MFKSSFQTPSRRSFLKSSIAGAAVAVALPAGAFAQDGKVLKVAGIYTVPVEQQWVSRIHIAATAAQEAGDIEYTYSENTANTDYPRVMREYAEQGYDLIVGEIFGVEAEAREVARVHPGAPEERPREAAPAQLRFGGAPPQGEALANREPHAHFMR